MTRNGERGRGRETEQMWKLPVIPDNLFNYLFNCPINYYRKRTNGLISREFPLAKQSLQCTCSYTCIHVHVQVKLYNVHVYL